jgi:hypothetical protein
LLQAGDDVVVIDDYSNREPTNSEQKLDDPATVHVAPKGPRG